MAPAFSAASTSTHELARPLRRFAAALRELGGARDVDEMLQLAVDLATELIRGIDVADIMFVRNGHITVPVSTDSLAHAVDRVQQEVGEGPCLTAIQDDPIVVVRDLARDDRWPAFAERASKLGVRSVLAYRLFVEHDGTRDRMGALNLFGRHSDLDDDSVDLGGVFAGHCSAVLKAAMANEGLKSALQSRDVIGQAKGILMERHRLTAEQAYEMLRNASHELNTKVRDLAEEVTRTGHLPNG